MVDAAGCGGVARQPRRCINDSADSATVVVVTPGRAAGGRSRVCGDDVTATTELRRLLPFSSVAVLPLRMGTSSPLGEGGRRFGGGGVCAKSSSSASASIAVANGSFQLMLSAGRCLSSLARLSSRVSVARVQKGRHQVSSTPPDPTATTKERGILTHDGHRSIRPSMKDSRGSTKV